MGKEIMLRVRIDELEDQKLEKLKQKYNIMTKSQIIREAILNYETILENRVFTMDIQRILKGFGSEYSIEDYGVIDNDILLGKGIWVKLSAKYSVVKRKCITYGKCKLIMEDDKISIEGGYFNDIIKCLKILHKERVKGGAAMNYFSISDKNENVKSYAMISYEITKRENCVSVKLNSQDFSAMYELRPDERFKSIEEIKNYVEKLFSKIIEAGYILKISEYPERMYVYLGYETDEEYVSGQFTGERLL